MRAIVATILIGVSATFASSAHAEVVNFDSDKPSAPPAGWHHASSA
jgi:hypothetical protein